MPGRQMNTGHPGATPSLQLLLYRFEQRIVHESLTARENFLADGSLPRY
jgi:hypothetical protein